jgi:hypothetical protein
VQRAVAIETARGWRIAREKVSHKIDVVVALGMAALAAVQQGISARKPMNITAGVLAQARQLGGGGRHSELSQGIDLYRLAQMQRGRFN